MKKLSTAVCIALATTSGSVCAGTIYNCEVTQFFKMEMDLGPGMTPKTPGEGPLVPKLKGTDYGYYYLGKRFSVDTGTGVMLGELMNVTAPDLERHILDPGTGGNAFKLIEVWGPIRGVRYTSIITFDQEGTKPFMMVDSDGVLSGECR